MTSLFQKHLLLLTFIAVSTSKEKSCNIQNLDSKATPFGINITLPEIPYIIKRNWPLSELSYLTERHNLIDKYGDLVVDLSSSNTYAQGKASLPLQTFITEHVDVQIVKEANETLYLFGQNYESIMFKELSKLYRIPHCSICESAGMQSIGLGTNDCILLQYQ